MTERITINDRVDPIETKMHSACFEEILHQTHGPTGPTTESSTNQAAETEEPSTRGTDHPEPSGDDGTDEGETVDLLPPPFSPDIEGPPPLIPMPPKRQMQDY